MAQDVWYYAVDDRRQGPVGRGEIDRMWRIGTIGPGTLVWRDGMDDWTPAGEVLGEMPGRGRGPATAAPPGLPAGRVREPSGRAAPGDYHEEVGLAEAMRRAINGYADFSGRANRGEFWWYVLGSLLISIGLSLADLILFGSAQSFSPLANLWALATLLPSLAITTRRLHDTDRSGWLQLVSLIPLIGLILIIVWCAQQGEPRPNRFG